MASYGRALSALHPTFATIFHSLEEGLEEAQRYHTEMLYRRSDDPHLFLHLARRRACAVLEREGLSARQVDETAALNLSGILIHHQGFAVRVLHAQHEGGREVEIPVPGSSKPRQDFWRQASAIPDLETDNLLLLWGDDGGVLTDPLTLVRPLGGDNLKANLRVEWRGKISREMAKLRAEDLVDLEPDWQAEELA
ncbi:hypothetical protein RB614_40265 [Phytohabitans sp. ZYX-F-186]|uniref:Uncharacterized protein n=1 Tax=Phytohabitans maris TaxID=3071409 RepID=A0ABU0ZVC9_9ACTN|nr:hypothetical protein [Phytohabitans sp. ZYX-F-186]MDQ7910746.1 hypothetical protein [Phytohabitans sp. ZYX-F-186]